VENEPAVPAASEERARRPGPVNPLTIAIGLLLLAAGGGLGWRMKTDAPSARPTPQAAAAALALEPLDPGLLCDARGEESLREAALRGDSGEAPELLRDRLPRRSPLPGHEPGPRAELDPATAHDALPGAVEAWVAAFGPEGEGGFRMYAYRYLTRQGAAGELAARVADRVCELDAVPFGARGRPGMVVLREGRDASEWWTSRSDVVTVVYRGWGDADAALANVAAIAGATALF
jgi:hypothetical protein